MKQLLEIQGEAFDLDGLAELFQCGNAQIREVGERYYLELELPETDPDDKKIDSARLKLHQMNAIAQIHFSNHRLVSLLGITNVNPETGALMTVVNFSLHAHARTRASIKPSINGVVLGRASPAFGANDMGLDLLQVDETHKRFKKSLRAEAKVPFYLCPSCSPPKPVCQTD